MTHPLNDLYGIKIVCPANWTYTESYIGEWIFAGPRWYQWLASRLGIQSWSHCPMIRKTPDDPLLDKIRGVLYCAPEHKTALQEATR